MLYSVLNRVNFKEQLSIIDSNNSIHVFGKGKSNLRIRLTNKSIEKKLFRNQIEMNKSMESKIIKVLVENKLENQNKYFGRNKYLSSVIFNGNKNYIGKVIKIKINNSNQNTLFGEVQPNMKAA